MICSNKSQYQPDADSVKFPGQDLLPQYFNHALNGHLEFHLGNPLVPVGVDHSNDVSGILLQGFTEAELVRDHVEYFLNLVFVDEPRPIFIHFLEYFRDEPFELIRLFH